MSRKRGNTQYHTKTKFIMKGNSVGYFKNETIIQFKLAKKNPFYKKVLETPLFPTFNRDGKHYTPTFILPKLQTVKQQQYMALHNQKLQESLKQLDIEQIMVPKPRSKNKYCGVCRSYYEQYLDHIGSLQHKNSLQLSNFHKYIGNLCRQYQNKHIENEMTLMQKTISIQTKLNEDQNSTQSFIELKKQNPDEQIAEIHLHL